MTQFPRWLEFSGLPQKIAGQLGVDGWLILKKLIELDCLSNPQPDLFYEPIERIAQMTGVASSRVRALLESLRELEYIDCYLPETDAEPAYLKIRSPISTPIKPTEIPFADGGLNGATDPITIRYYHPAKPVKLENGTKFAQILHWYFDLCGMRMNNIILDELKELEANFDIDKIKAAFQKAKQNNIRSLNYVFKQLYAPLKKDKPKNPKTKKRKNQLHEYH
ncbi:MAG: hypothetical protein N3A72_05415 [bacterium]|nr:hypothetical protein [bacterium]